MKLYSWKKYLLGFITLIVFAGFFPGQDEMYFEISKNIDLFGRIYKEISFGYVDEIDPEQFMRSGIEGMLSSLDPYTVFIDESKQDEIDLITNGKYGGVGISIGIRGDEVTIVDVLDGYSAQRQGVHVGDILIEAAGKKVSAKNVDDISTLVKGEPGTAVELKMTRNEGADTVVFNLIREEVIIKNILYSGFYPVESNNVYLKLSNFSRTAADELKNDLKELKTQKEIKSIVLDLRGNPGGLLDIAVDICDKFLPKDDLIVSTKGRDAASSKSYFAQQQPMLASAKLVVLVNEGSASASEIVAGAMQDHDRGIILGNKTFGKGLVQTISPLSYNTSLKITTAKYYTPSGRCIQKIDYSHDNKVIANPDSLISAKYFTDNKRVVYGNGGITPDTVVNYKIEGNITKSLLAKGIFFQFADNYLNKNPNEQFGSLKDDKLFSDLSAYLKEKNFIFKSDAEKEIDKLVKQADDNNLDKTIHESLIKIKNEFKKIDDGELQIYKIEIVRELKTELASRYLGNKGKIEQFLKYDPQFQTAINIVNDEKVYNSILTKN
ncbi:MAG: S41 family peptidase [Ignavibacteriaceae bacterium]|nr:S41 family peptidase [Ignavibacteriaceae bacterium]